MSYSEITFEDKNPIKRWLQKQRLVSALKVAQKTGQKPLSICDFGAGNGELCKYLAVSFPEASIFCYEPANHLFKEAQQNLNDIKNVIFCKNISEIQISSMDLIFSLEVFEHLPELETNDALHHIHALLKPKGQLVIGVPVEVGIPALYKGVFRMVRRYVAFDASIKNILNSFIGNPPLNRPTKEIMPGFNYHLEHVGFDYRNFMKILSSHFAKPELTSSPFSTPGPWLMPEVNFTVEKS